jgi:hypothetical protein
VAAVPSALDHFGQSVTPEAANVDAMRPIWISCGRAMQYRDV